MAKPSKRANEKHGQCVHFRLEKDCRKMGQCLCPVPPRFHQWEAYNTVWRDDPIDSHFHGFSCPCFKPKRHKPPPGG